MSSLLSTLATLLPTSPFPRPKRVTLLITGLDNAGKTTLIHRMRNPDPNDNENNGLPSSGDIHLTTQTTTGGRKRLILNPIDTGLLQYRHHPGGIHQLWRDFLNDGNVSFVVFVVDAADAERFDKAVMLFGSLLRILDEMERKGDVERTKIPVLVLGNKIDHYGAVAEAELRERLGLKPGCGRNEGAKEENSRPMELFMCSAVTRQGYPEGFDWLTGYL
ncbi:ADP-ribosylation factor family-domain-containing protein [Immersiella caudata]|uniref:ADP-ribosylation factor family-domain-containing protein n=1 Tax=Immersiella caudata TaxID=314043 RepID=A0AA40C2U0_9PEZI|nr:ADP-ribosylation factor family-domain-containing protein [Immersiella caudata]